MNSDGVSSYANSATYSMLMMFPAVHQAIQQGSSTALKDICAPYATIADCNLDCLY